MTALRILHVDDEPDIREVAEISLSLDPGLTTRTCGSGEEALVVAAEWMPDVILLDAMMPIMDGPATLAKLRENPATAKIPIIFMTARAQSREVDRFRALGAIGVIAKPFDPMSLAGSIRSYVVPAADPIDQLRASFLLRIEKNTAALISLRTALRNGSDIARKLAAIRHLAHGLAGAGGIFGFIEISETAALLEDAIVLEQDGVGAGEVTGRALDALIGCGELTAGH